MLLHLSRTSFSLCSHFLQQKRCTGARRCGSGILLWFHLWTLSLLPQGVCRSFPRSSVVRSSQPRVPVEKKVPWAGNVPCFHPDFGSKWSRHKYWVAAFTSIAWPKRPWYRTEWWGTGFKLHHQKTVSGEISSRPFTAELVTPKKVANSRGIPQMRWLMLLMLVSGSVPLRTSHGKSRCFSWKIVDFSHGLCQFQLSGKDLLSLQLTGSNAPWGNRPRPPQIGKALTSSIFIHSQRLSWVDFGWLTGPAAHALLVFRRACWLSAGVCRVLAQRFTGSMPAWMSHEVRING